MTTENENPDLNCYKLTIETEKQKNGITVYQILYVIAPNLSAATSIPLKNGAIIKRAKYKGKGTVVLTSRN